MALIVQLEVLRRRAAGEIVTDAASFAAAVLKAAPALIEAARVVAEGGQWACETPIPRIGPSGFVEDWDDCGGCFPCRLNAARERLAEVEL
jgi:hypothetical protein